MSTVSIEIPSEILLDLNKNENEFARYMKQYVALDLYVKQNISLGYCAKMAGILKEDFILFLGNNNVSIFDFENENDFLEELNNA